MHVEEKFRRIIEAHPDGVLQLFKAYNIDAPVTPDNLASAVIVHGEPFAFSLEELVTSDFDFLSRKGASPIDFGSTPSGLAGSSSPGGATTTTKKTGRFWDAADNVLGIGGSLADIWVNVKNGTSSSKSNPQPEVQPPQYIPVPQPVKDNKTLIYVGAGFGVLMLIMVMVIAMKKS